MKRNRRPLLFLGSLGVLLLLSSAALLYHDFALRLQHHYRELAAPILLRAVLMCALVTGAICLAGAMLYCVQRKKTRLLAEERERYYRSSRQDCLTGLLNKGAFACEVEQFIRSDPARQRRGALLVVDLDDFKAVNDTCGHAAGDCSLLLTARLLGEAFPPSTLLGRAGGDEFVAWLPGVSDPGALQRRAAGLCRALCQHSEELPLQGRLSCSVGAALYPRDGACFSALFDAADAAMYRAKKQGKNTCALAPASKQPGGGQTEQ